MSGQNIFSKLFSSIVRLFFKPAPYPVGLKIILWYTAVLAIFQFLMGFLVPVMYPDIKNINPFVTLFNIFFLAISALIIYGMTKRKYWAYKLTISWYAVAIIYNFLYFFYSYDSFDVLKEILLIGLVFSFLVNCSVIWYLISQHDYFKHNGIFLFHKRIHIKMMQANDQIFTVVFISLWFVTLIVLLFSSAKLLHQTFEITKEISLQFEKEGSYKSQICYNTKDPLYKDICLMNLGIILQNKKYCNDVSSSFYRFTCSVGI